MSENLEASILKMFPYQPTIVTVTKLALLNKGAAEDFDSVWWGGAYANFTQFEQFRPICVNIVCGQNFKGAELRSCMVTAHGVIQLSKMECKQN